MNKKSSNATAFMIIMALKPLFPLPVRGLTAAQQPMISTILYIPLPMMLPKAISSRFFSTPEIVTANSGRLVPIATTVSEIIRGSTPIFAADHTTVSTMSLAPSVIMIKDNTIKPDALLRLITGASDSSASSLFLQST